MNKWWELSIDDLINKLKGSDYERLARAFDIKYGNYDYSNDVRQLCEAEFTKSIDGFTVDLRKGASVLICGANSGYEVPYLKNYNLTALDISGTALTHLKKSFTQVEVVEGSMDDLPFRSASFDGYINLRAVQSVGVDLNKAVNEAMRVTKAGGSILFSIPDGYMDSGTLIKGMLNGTDLYFDQRLPYTLRTELEILLDRFGVTRRRAHEIPSELFIQAMR